MSKFFLAVLMGFILSSCLSDKQLELKFLPLNEDQIQLTSYTEMLKLQKLELSGIKQEVSDNLTDSLYKELEISLNNFENNPLKQNLNSAENLWETILNSGIIYDSAFIFSWMESSERLLCATGKITYANELENILYTLYRSGLYSELIEVVTPFIYTKDVDHIHVNLFYNSTINYFHTLGGKVEIEQIVYSNKNNIDLHFGVEEKKYIELYIRIPEWVNEAEVEVKNVFYLAKPGQYCKIAKKWKEGDVVHIRFK